MPSLRYAASGAVLVMVKGSTASESMVWPADFERQKKNPANRARGRTSAATAAERDCLAREVGRRRDGGAGGEAAQREGQVVGGVEALAGLLVETAIDDALK